MIGMENLPSMSDSDEDESTFASGGSDVEISLNSADIRIAQTKRAGRAQQSRTGAKLSGIKTYDELIQVCTTLEGLK